MFIKRKNIDISWGCVYHVNISQVYIHGIGLYKHVFTHIRKVDI